MDDSRHYDFEDFNDVDVLLPRNAEGVPHTQPTKLAETFITLFRILQLSLAVSLGFLTITLVINLIPFQFFDGMPTSSNKCKYLASMTIKSQAD